jgi:hypothetical protein
MPWWISCSLVIVVPVAVFVAVFRLVMHHLKHESADNSSTPSGFYALAILLGAVYGFLVLVVTFLVLMRIPPDMSPVQSALDTQCGTGRYVADAKGYSTDPGEYWNGNGAFCENKPEQGWSCNC